MSLAPTVTSLADTSRLSAVRYTCRADAHAPAAVEVHSRYTLALVLSGNFGHEGRAAGGARSERRELVRGAVLVGAPGDEFVCTHDHTRCGDVCLSFSFHPGLLDDAVGARFERALRAQSLPPLADVAVAAAGVDVDDALAVEELGVELCGRIVGLLDDGAVPSARAPSPSDRRRALAAVALIQARFAEPLTLDELAGAVGVSPFHFARSFRSVVGAAPHQYLLQSRLAAVARLLVDVDDDRSIADKALACGFGDVSGFVRTFKRAAGVSPRAYLRRQSARSKNLQDR